MINYIKRVAKAVLNRSDPVKVVEKKVYSTDKEYSIQVDKKRFIDQVAVITGASGCLGGVISWRLALEGSTTYLCGRNENRLIELSSQLQDVGCKAHVVIVDSNDAESIESAVRKIAEDEQHIDVLVNCAGGSTREKCKPLIDQDVELIDQILSVNLRGSMLFTRAVGKNMKENNYGRIVNISSIIGEHGKPKFSDYAAAKAGIIGYTKTVAQELGHYNITVNCVSPGFIQRGTYTDDQLPYLLNSNFMNRVGTPDDVAAAVAFIASKEAGFITGQNLCVDGGRSLGLHGDS